MSIIEWIAVLTGLACVWLTVVRNIWCWPTGLVSVALYVFVFFDARLYSDMGLQVVYIFMQVYGWWFWLRGGKDRGEAPVVRLSPPGMALWAGAVVAGTVLLGTLMSAFTNAALPYWDAAATAMSLAAQWLLARKVIENWILWIAVDVLSVGIYLAKGLYPTTGLYCVFLVLATMGLIAWTRTLRAQAPQPA
jgi:nicotinamide mononucleotide transporter